MVFQPSFFRGELLNFGGVKLSYTPTVFGKKKPKKHVFSPGATYSEPSNISQQQVDDLPSGLCIAKNPQRRGHELPSPELTAESPEKCMVGRWISFWDSLFSGVMLVSRVSWWFQPIWRICSSNWIISSVAKIQHIWNHHSNIAKPCRITKKIRYLKWRNPQLSGQFIINP